MFQGFEKDIAIKFVRYFYKKHNDNEDEALKEILRFGIKEFYYAGSNQIVIICKRPGLLIGLKGELLEELKKETECKITLLEARPDVNDAFEILLDDMKEVWEE